MSRLKMLILPTLLLIVCSPFFIKSAGAEAASQKGCGTWRIISSPGTHLAYNEFDAVAGTSTSDVWAVGYALKPPSGTTLIEHWNGTQWSIVPSLSPGSYQNFLGQVTAISPNNAWTVGAYLNRDGGPSMMVIEHWDGSSWSVVNSPSPGAANFLSGIKAVSANDIWAVGAYTNSDRLHDQPLIEHWDGTKWSIVPSPSPGAGSGLGAVAAVSSTDVWAVGGGSGGSGGLIEHWDGTSWSISSNPSGLGGLFAVAAVSATDVWALGGTQTVHWNGTSWSIVPIPIPGGYARLLSDVAAVSANDVWAVGFYQVSPYSRQLGLIEHWNGAKWQVVPHPNPKFASTFRGVTALSASAVWAVGSYGRPSYSSLPLTEFC